jgi:hypothetical protein
MIDPLSAGFVDLEQAVARLATDISDQEVDEEQRRQKNDAATLSPAGLHWVKREMAIARLYAAFCCGSLIAMVRDPVSGALIRLIGTDWKQAAFWRDTIVGGIVRRANGGGRIRCLAERANTTPITAGQSSLPGMVRSRDAGGPHARG